MKIPKLIIQTSILKPAGYIVTMLNNRSSGWKYNHFNDEEIVKYINENPIPEFNNSVDVFNSFEKGQHKSDFFRYYFLYLNGGVYIDSDAMLEKNIEDIFDENCEFFTVKSAIKTNNSMFNGFIGCMPKHVIMYEALKSMYDVDKKVLSDDYFLICKKLYNIIENYNNILKSLFVNSSNLCHVKIFTEELYKDGVCATINNKKEVLLLHYYNKEIIPSDIKPVDRSYNSKNTKIGITIDLPENTLSIFSNGIRQNVLFLGELLLNIGYDCYFIIEDKKFNSEVTNELLYSPNFKYIKKSSILLSNFDLVIIMGYEIETEIIKQLRYLKTKVIYYLCGNSYIMDSEKILYDQHSVRDCGKYVNKSDYILYDEIWCIPQMTNTNRYYIQTLQRCKCIEVPFIWSPNAIKLAMIAEKKMYDEIIYKKNEEPSKKIVIFEPNISIMKWCFPSLLVCENAYRKNNELIKQVFVNNITDKKTGINNFNLTSFNKIVNNLDLCSDKKVSVETRYPTLGFISKHADIAVSHQLENNLNYLYFDLAWMGYPIVHNASLCKDVGYYYDQFNYEEGGEILTNCIKNHDATLDDYILNNRNAINKYLTTNDELQHKYIHLIQSLFSNNEPISENIVLEIVEDN